MSFDPRELGAGEVIICGVYLLVLWLQQLSVSWLVQLQNQRAP